jgi:hypothetical protein
MLCTLSSFCSAEFPCREDAEEEEEEAGREEEDQKRRRRRRKMRRSRQSRSFWVHAARRVR